MAITPPLPQRSTHIRRRHNLHNYTSLVSTNRSYNMCSSVGTPPPDPLNNGFTVFLWWFSCYGRLIEVSNVMNHTLRLDNRIARNLPIEVTRFILSRYHSQQVQVFWKAAKSEAISVTQIVRQKSVLSPIRFALYIDDLLITY